MSSPSIAIRPAVDADGPALSALIGAVFAEYEGVVFVPEEFPELAAPASHFAAHGGGLWVLEETTPGGPHLGGSIAVAMTREPGVAELFKVYLAPHLRGRGYARTLFETVRAFAAVRGATALTLWSDIKFVDGHRFYERQGFLRLPGLRALHDASDTLEIPFRLDLATTGAVA